MDDRQAEALVRSPTESLTVELKSWLNLEDPGHKAKLVRALLALRNSDGGIVLIGFDDKTGLPSPGAPSHPDITYHIDEMQPLVSAYASDPFPIIVRHAPRDGVLYPVIQVPSGVRVPVAVSRGIVLPTTRNEKEKVLLRKGDVLVRTLRTNNTLSSAAAEPGDWPRIMDICFNNREADLGGFVRRHLFSGELPSLLAELGLFAQQSKRPGRRETCVAFADRCIIESAKIEESRSLSPLPDSFGWVEIAAVMDPPATGFIADSAFLSRMLHSRPRYSHDMWLDGRVHDQKPFPTNGGWNTLIDLSGFWDLREFSRLEPGGKFYLKRSLAEDASAAVQKARAGVAVDLQTTFETAAQSMAIVLAFAQALTPAPTETKVGFLLRYKGLLNRRLISLIGAVDLVVRSYQSGTDTFEKFVELPADTSPVNLGPFVFEAVREFLALFDGYTITLNRAEQETRRALQPT